MIDKNGKIAFRERPIIVAKEAPPSAAERMARDLAVIRERVGWILLILALPFLLGLLMVMMAMFAIAAAAK